MMAMLKATANAIPPTKPGARRGWSSFASINGNTLVRWRPGWHPKRVNRRFSNPQCQALGYPWQWSLRRQRLLAETWHKILTGSQQAAWEALAATVTLVNWVGETYRPNGFELFQFTNSGHISFDINRPTSLTTPLDIIPDAPATWSNLPAPVIDTYDFTRWNQLTVHVTNWTSSTGILSSILVASLPFRNQAAKSARQLYTANVAFGWASFSGLAAADMSWAGQAPNDGNLLTVGLAGLGNPFGNRSAYGYITGLFGLSTLA